MKSAASNHEVRPRIYPQVGRKKCAPGSSRRMPSVLPTEAKDSRPIDSRVDIGEGGGLDWTWDGKVKTTVKRMTFLRAGHEKMALGRLTSASHC